MGSEGHRSSCTRSIALLHHFSNSCMSYWWAMGTMPKAAALLMSKGLGPIPRSACTAVGHRFDGTPGERIDYGKCMQRWRGQRMRQYNQRSQLSMQRTAVTL